MRASRVRGEYDALAARYDRRWERYTRESLGLLRPLLAAGDAGRVLDLGCGTGALVPLLGEWGVRVRRYTGADLSPGMLRVAAGKGAAAGFPAAFAAAAAEALPFRDGAFDTVVSASSLHFWARPEGALADVRRVLRPGGRLLLVDWCRDPLPMRVLDLWLRASSRGRSHHRVYSLAEVRGLLGRAGFRVASAERAPTTWPWTLLRAEAVKPR